MKGVCPKCREVIELDEISISDEELEDFDEFDEADLDNKEKKLNRKYEEYYLENDALNKR